MDASTQASSLFHVFVLVVSFFCVGIFAKFEDVVGGLDDIVVGWGFRFSSGIGIFGGVWFWLRVDPFALRGSVTGPAFVFRAEPFFSLYRFWFVFFLCGGMFHHPVWIGGSLGMFAFLLVSPFFLEWFAFAVGVGEVFYLCFEGEDLLFFGIWGVPCSLFDEDFVFVGHLCHEGVGVENGSIVEVVFFLGHVHEEGLVCDCIVAFE